MQKISTVTFFLLLLFILAVNSYDLYFSVKHEAMFMDFECNPIARQIYNCFGVNGIIVFKCSIMAFVATILTVAWCDYHKYKLCLFAASVMAIAQAYLVYLYILIGYNL
jgi:hypothetical protein